MDQGPVARKAGLWGLTLEERKLILRRLFQPILYREGIVSNHQAVIGNHPEMQKEDDDNDTETELQLVKSKKSYHPIDLDDIDNMESEQLFFDDDDKKIHHPIDVDEIDNMECQEQRQQQHVDDNHINKHPIDVDDIDDIESQPQNYLDDNHQLASPTANDDHDNGMDPQSLSIHDDNKQQQRHEDQLRELRLNDQRLDEHETKPCNVSLSQTLSDPPCSNDEPPSTLLIQRDDHNVPTTVRENAQQAEQYAATPTSPRSSGTGSNNIMTDGGGVLLDETDLEHTCAICLREYTYGDTVVSGTGCSHLFHYECVMPWLEKHDHCPYCRNEMMTAVQMRSAALQVLGEARVLQMAPSLLPVPPPPVAATTANAASEEPMTPAMIPHRRPPRRRYQERDRY
jgi:hypothetical protein